MGLLSTAALLSTMYKLPSAIRSKESHSAGSQDQGSANYNGISLFHKRLTSPYLPSQRQYLDPPPARFSLDSLMNRLFRRPYQADIRPPQYRARPQSRGPPQLQLAYPPQLEAHSEPIWSSLPLETMPSLPSKTYYTYSQYGMPSMSTSSHIFSPPVIQASSSQPSSTQSPVKTGDESVIKDGKEWASREVDERVGDTDDEEYDDDYDDHFYSEDFPSPFEGPFKEAIEAKAEKSSEKSSVEHFYYKGRQEKKLRDKKNVRNETAKVEDKVEYIPNPSKSSYTYAKKGKTTSTSTTEATTKDCSPGSKVNYHYHMYMVKKMPPNESVKKKTTPKRKAKSTTTSSPYPVYPEASNTAEKYQPTSSVQLSYGNQIPSISDESEAFGPSGDLPKSVISYKEPSENSEYFYQVVTSSSYIEPYSESSSYVQLAGDSPLKEAGDNEKRISKAGGHFDSDYYNNLLLTKILGINPNGKVMPIENYATEKTGNGPLVNYNYRSKSDESSNMFELGKDSKLYVTRDKVKPKDNGKVENNKKKNPSKAKN